MTDAWVSGKTYVPGSLVRPASTAPVSQTQATNGDFEAGATGWDFSGSCALATSGGYGSANCCIAPGSTAGGEALNQAKFYGQPGNSISASCVIQQGASDVDHTRGYVRIHFYKADDTEIGSPISGNIVNDGRGGAWKPSSGSAAYPAEASYARIGIYLYQNSADPIWGDNLVITYAYQAPSGLVYKAVQAAPGKSASSEPAWPLTLGVQVIDNEVIWEAVQATRITWTASPIAESGATEPAWPLTPGSVVHDGNMDWIGTSSQITDPNCPQSTIVIMAASKIYVGDNDIIRYCATVNPLDWTTANDAGFLPYGLQNYGSNPVAALGLYRSNVIAFNAEGMQNWQVDEDPANTALLDALPIASTHHLALSPTSTDLFFLSSKGIRSVGIAATGVSLQNGDVGMPVDELVKGLLAAAISNNNPPIATYVPAEGQYWVSFGDTYVSGVATTAHVLVYTINRPNAPGRWGRYLFPFPIDDFTQLNDHLYIRSGDAIMRVEPDAAIDFEGSTFPDYPPTPFDGVVWWPWLDLGSAGVDKQLIGADITGEGTPTIDIGYDQSNMDAFTVPYDVPDDSVPGQLIPIECMAPSFSLRVTYKGGTVGQKWKLQATNLYWQTMRKTAG